MPLHLYAAFVAAVAILMLIPGPNVALIVANSIAHGARYGLVTVAGTSAAMVVQLALTALGMTTLLGALAQGFEILRWAGVAYLVFLGLRAWRSRPLDLTRARPEPRAAPAIFLRGFLVSLTNPKTLLFYAAFLPQFVDATGHVGRQLAILSATFVALALILDGGWALLAARLRGVLGVNGRLRDRLTGSLLIAAGLGLALARKS